VVAYLEEILNLQVAYLEEILNLQEAYLALTQRNLQEDSLDLNLTTAIRLDYLAIKQDRFLETMQLMVVDRVYLVLNQKVPVYLGQNLQAQHYLVESQESHYLDNRNQYSEKVLVKKIRKKMKMKTIMETILHQMRLLQLPLRIKLPLKVHSPSYMSAKFQNIKFANLKSKRKIVELEKCQFKNVSLVKKVKQSLQFSKSFLKITLEKSSTKVQS
jgi:hypothetical protein